MARGTKTYTTGKIRSSRTNSIINTYSNVNPALIFQAGTDYEFQKQYYAPELNSIDCIDPDVSPNPYTFTDVTGSNISTVNTSNTITISGLGSGNIIAVSIIGGGEYSKNGGAYTSSAGTATNADTFAVRATSSSLYITAVNVTLTTGDYSDTYTITTKVAPAVTVNYSLSKGANPYVDILFVPTVNGTNIGNIYPTSTGTFGGIVAGNSVYIGLVHAIASTPWPDNSKASLVITADGTTIFNSGDITDPTILGLTNYTFTALEGVVYQVNGVSSSTSTAYTNRVFNMDNQSTAPLSTNSEIISFDFVDNTDLLFKLHTAQYIQPHNNISFNWLTDANTGKLTIVNNSLVNLDFALSNIPHGGAYNTTITILAGATGIFNNIPKTSYTITYVNTPAL